MQTKLLSILTLTGFVTVTLVGVKLAADVGPSDKGRDRRPGTEEKAAAAEREAGAQVGQARPARSDGDGTFKVAPVHNLLRARPRLDAQTKIGRLAFRDLDGREHRLSELRNKGPVVFVFTSTVCPLAKRYTQRLRRLHEQFAPQGVAFFAVFSNEEDTREDVAGYAKKAAYPFPAVRDAGGYLARRLGATVSPQAFVVDQEGELRYRGGIDDNRYETRVKNRYLQDALSAVLKGRAVEVPEGPSLGCTIHLEREAASIREVTYSSHVARILQDNCQGCHRPKQVAPFALTNYEQARRWAKEIMAYTQARVMPPWKAARGFGRFKNDRSLTDEEIALIARWVDDGAPPGDPQDLPPAPRFHDEWALGEPDIVLEMPDEYTIGPEGEDDYRHFVIPTDSQRDLYVQAIDVQPGNRRTVHHVIVYVDKTGKARRLDAADAGPGYTRFGGPGFNAASVLGGWAPGTRPEVAPEGTGSWLPAGADVVLQVHYYRTGFEEKDRTRVGLYLSRTQNPVKVHRAAAMPLERRPNGGFVRNGFEIPAGEVRYRIQGYCPIREPIYLISVFPHMHLLGREMKVVAEHPDWQEPRPLVWIKDWDFNWQTGYQLEKPMLLPQGTKIRLQAWYDNSAGNPHNPHSPPQPVRYGEKTTDEMCYAFFRFVKASEYEPIAERESEPLSRRP